MVFCGKEEEELRCVMRCLLNTGDYSKGRMRKRGMRRSSVEGVLGEGFGREGEGRDER